MMRKGIKPPLLDSGHQSHGRATAAKPPHPGRGGIVTVAIKKTCMKCNRFVLGKSSLC